MRANSGMERQRKDMSGVIVVGGGAAGMMAAAAAAEAGRRTALYEKNEKLGKKLYLTGKGRCNVTNTADRETFFAQQAANPKFLYSAYEAWDNQDTIEWMRQRGLPLKEERGGRIFPVSDKSSDVIRLFQRELARLGVEVHLNTPVRGLDIRDGSCRGILLADGNIVPSERVIVATGGLSYPSTGSTGDGYRFAEEAGLRLTDRAPGLVPFTAEFPDGRPASLLQGLSLKNVGAAVYQGKKCLFRERGEMLFTHFGVSGPLMLTASSRVTRQIRQGPLRLEIDWKPALRPEQLDARLLREFDVGKNRNLGNVMGSLLPASAIPAVLVSAGLSPEKKIHEVTKEERRRLAGTLKCFVLTLTGLRDYPEAIITRGGVSVKELNPATMEAKKVPGLFFAGEVLDLDAMTGGYNLQIAWTTGRAAGKGAAAYE